MARIVLSARKNKMLRGSILLSAIAALAACSSTAPADGPLHECTYDEWDVAYAVGYRVPPVDAGLPLAVTGEECMPPAVVSPDDGGRVDCIMLVTLPGPGGESTCAEAGFEIPSQSVLTALRVQRPDAAPYATCLVPQLLGPDLDALGSCSDSSKAGWCYVTGVAAKPCTQTILTTNSTIVPGAAYAFECAQGC